MKDGEGEGWEEVEAGDSAENGTSEELPTEGTVSARENKVESLPDVPTKDPSDNGPAAKKQKPNE